MNLLIRVLIEVAFEIDDFLFLFSELYQKIKDVDYAELFSLLVKPYILCGLFSEWEAPEHILNFHVL
jgi:hypothetical protein